MRALGDIWVKDTPGCVCMGVANSWGLLQRLASIEVHLALPFLADARTSAHDQYSLRRSPFRSICLILIRPELIPSHRCKTTKDSDASPSGAPVEWVSDICVLLRNTDKQTVQAAAAQHVRRSVLQPLWKRKRDSYDYKAIMEGGEHQNQEAPVRRSASPSEIIQIEALYGPLEQKCIL